MRLNWLQVWVSGFWPAGNCWNYAIHSISILAMATCIYISTFFEIRSGSLSGGSPSQVWTWPCRELQSTRIGGLPLGSMVCISSIVNLLLVVGWRWLTMQDCLNVLFSFNRHSKPLLYWQCEACCSIAKQALMRLLRLDFMPALQTCMIFELATVGFEQRL